MSAPTDSSDHFAQYAHPETLVSTDWVAEHIDDPNVVVVESNEDVLLYDTGHIPGAIKIDWHMDLNDAVTRDYLDRGGFADRAVFEAGDALETIERYDGPFDVVLVDHQKHRYPDAFEAVREKVRPGGVVVADNAMVSGIQDFDAILDALEGGDPDLDDESRGIAEYLTTVRDDPAFETSVVPLGEGIAVSYRRQGSH